MFQPKKFTPAGLEIWDPPGLPPGTSEADKDAHAAALGSLREADAYVVVVRGLLDRRLRLRPRGARPRGRLGAARRRAPAVRPRRRRGARREAARERRRSAQEPSSRTRASSRSSSAACRASRRARASWATSSCPRRTRKRLRGFQFFTRKPYLRLVNGPAGVPTGFGDGPGACPIRGAPRARRHARGRGRGDGARRPALVHGGVRPPSRPPRALRPRHLPRGRPALVLHGGRGRGARLDDPRGRRRRHGGGQDPHRPRQGLRARRGLLVRRARRRGRDEGAQGRRTLLRLEPKDYVVKDGDIVHIRSAV